MNRPKIDDFKTIYTTTSNDEIVVDNYETYSNELEKYCDEVEQTTNYLYGEKLILEEKVYELSKFQLHLLKEKAKVEKALDKAFDRVNERFDYMNEELHPNKHYQKPQFSLDTLQELIDKYSKLEKSLDYLLNYLDKKYLLDEEKSCSRYLYKELLEEDIRRMLESEKQ